MITTQLNDLDKRRIKNLVRSYLLEKSSFVLLAREEFIFIKEGKKFLQKKERIVPSKEFEKIPLRSIEEMERELDLVDQETDEKLLQCIHKGESIALGNRLYGFEEYMKSAATFPKTLQLLKEKGPYSYSRTRAKQMIKASRGHPKENQFEVGFLAKAYSRKVLTQQRLMLRAAFFNEHLVYWKERLSDQGIRLNQATSLNSFEAPSYGQFWCSLTEDVQAQKAFNQLKIRGEINEAA